jgi:hypothetical protein
MNAVDIVLLIGAGCGILVFDMADPAVQFTYSARGFARASGRRDRFMPHGDVEGEAVYGTLFQPAFSIFLPST